MLAVERRALIVDRVREQGTVRVTDLVRELSVSGMTVRRDLDELARQGAIRKLHGGATLVGRTSTDEPGFEVKSTRQRAEKEAIARAALEYVRPGYVVALSAGTTTWTLARALDGVPDVTVVTNSPRIAEVADRASAPGRTVILIGGVRTPSDALVGPVAVAGLRCLNIDVAFFGAHGMDERAGFTSPNLLEGEANRALIARAQQTVVVADHTKWGTVGISTFAEPRDVDLLITDSGLLPAAQQILRGCAGELVVAQVEDTAQAE